jgi:hypothetical protein
MASYSEDLHFCIFDDVSGTPNGTLSGEVWLDQDPIYGGYDPFHEFNIRGVQADTMDWRYTHIYPISSGSDYVRKIKLSDGPTMTRTTLVAIASKFNSLGTVYRFYDGESIFRVWFSNSPPGFVYHREHIPWREGILLTNPPASTYLYYRYEIVLEVISVVSTTEGYA